VSSVQVLRGSSSALYGSDGVERIIGYMQRMKSGDLL
jgi:outer membrane cobalamin receptor